MSHDGAGGDGDSVGSDDCNGCSKDGGGGGDIDNDGGGCNGVSGDDGGSGKLVMKVVMVAEMIFVKNTPC